MNELPCVPVGWVSQVGSEINDGSRATQGSYVLIQLHQNEWYVGKVKATNLKSRNSHLIQYMNSAAQEKWEEFEPYSWRLLPANWKESLTTFWSKTQTKGKHKKGIKRERSQAFPHEKNMRKRPRTQRRKPLHPFEGRWSLDDSLSGGMHDRHVSFRGFMWLGPQFEGFLKTYPNRVHVQVGTNPVPNINLEFQGGIRYDGGHDGGQLAQATIQALDKKHGTNVVVEIRQVKAKECHISIRQAQKTTQQPMVIRAKKFQWNLDTKNGRKKIADAKKNPDVHDVIKKTQLKFHTLMSRIHDV